MQKHITLTSRQDAVGIFGARIPAKRKDMRLMLSAAMDWLRYELSKSREHNTIFLHVSKEEAGQPLTREVLSELGKLPAMIVLMGDPRPVAEGEVWL